MWVNIPWIYPYVHPFRVGVHCLKSAVQNKGEKKKKDLGFEGLLISKIAIQHQIYRCQGGNYASAGLFLRSHF